MNRYEKFQNDYGRLSEAPQERAKNYQDWCQATRDEWKAKPIEEVESYYINLRGYVTNLKHNPRNGIKARALIAKKKQWRDGLHAILCNDKTVGKHYRKAEVAKNTPSLPIGQSKLSDVQRELQKSRERKKQAGGYHDSEETEVDLRCDEKLE